MRPDWSPADPIAIDGVAAKQIANVLTNNGYLTASLAVPASAARSKSMVLIRFCFTDAASPRSLGLSDDRRELAMRLARVRIEAAPGSTST